MPTVPAESTEGGGRPALLCLSPSFHPDTTPTGIRATKLLRRLARDWDVTVLTESAGGLDAPGVRVQTIASRRPRRLLRIVRRLRLEKLLELLVWPDESVFWVRPAVRAGMREIERRRPEAILVFMMPYGGGLAGLRLSRRTGVPLVMNLDDSPTCTDMHPFFPTRLHHRLARALEDRYVRRSDAVLYVSARNLERVRERQSPRVAERMHLVRYGADSGDFPPQPQQEGRFEIAYAGAMSGWWSLLDEDPGGLAARLHGAWTRLGRHELVELDQRTSSPAVIGRAILDVLERRPDWRGRVHLTIHGNPYPDALVQRALEAAGVQDVVTVLGPVPHPEVATRLAGADLLFLTLPRRVDRSPGGRISAKTYEYLATDRPILAAVPAGENWSYLAGKPGVWLCEPRDERRMASVIEELAGAKFAGAPRSIDRGGLREELSYDTRATEFSAVIRAAIERRRGEAPKPAEPAEPAA